MRAEGTTSLWMRLPHPVRWIAVGAVGTTLVIVGTVMLVTPGPGIALIVLGLMVLATEFAWAETLLHHVKKRSTAAAGAARAAVARRSQRRSARLGGSD